MHRHCTEHFRAVDQYGQIIDAYVYLSREALLQHLPDCPGESVEVVTDMAPSLARVIDGLLPRAFHHTGQYENNRCEADHGRLKSRLRPLRGLKTN